MAGTIYCFNTVGDHRIYKAGHTQQELKSRLRGYLGPSRPRVIVASRNVDDSVAAETMVLGLLRQCSALVPRSDLGNEWFESRDGVGDDERHKAILFVFDVVSKAVHTRPASKYEEPSTSHSSLHVSETLPAMGAYFEALDHFVHTASPETLGTMDDILRSFEQSDSCPLFAEYVMWPRATRLAIAHNRFPHIS